MAIKRTESGKVDSKKGIFNILGKNKEESSGKGSMAFSPMVKLLGYKSLTNDDDAFLVLKEASYGYADLLNIRGQGLGTMSRNQQIKIINDFQNFLRVAIEDMKFIISPFPADTSSQQAFTTQMYSAVYKKLQTVEDERQRQQLQARLRYLDDQLKRNIQVEKELYNQEFIIMIFGKSRRNLATSRDNIIRWGGESLVIERLPRHKKEQVLFRINNLNTKIV